MEDKIVNKVLVSIKNAKTYLFPSSFAFYMLFALVPALTLIQFFLSLFSIPADFLQNYLRILFPNNIATNLIDFLSNGHSWKSFFSILFNLVVSLVIISNGFNAFINVSNSLYKRKNNMIKRRLKSLIITTGFIVLLFLFFTFSALMAYWVGESKLMTLGSILQIFIEVFLLFIMTLFIYSMAADNVLKLRDVWQGALFSAVSVAIAIFLFGLYSKYLTSFNDSYGPMTWLLVLLLLFQIIGVCIYIGLVLNTIVKANKDRLTKAIEKKNLENIEEKNI